jgi:hypothetical protein
MDELKEIIRMLLKEIEAKDNILNISGGRGYGTGKARVKDPFPVSHGLGNEEGEDQENYEKKPVKISKAFKRRKA